MTVTVTQPGGVPRRGWSTALRQFFDYMDWKTTAGVSKLGTLATKTGLTKLEAGAHAFRKTTFVLDAVSMALVDEAGVIAYTGQKLYDFPAGNILILGATADLVVRKSSAGVIDAFDAIFGVGRVTASNNNTLASTEQDIIPSTAMAQATGVGAAAVAPAKGINVAAIAPFDGTGTAIPLFLNFLVTDADHDVTTTPANLLVTGTVEVTWVNLGDK